MNNLHRELAPISDAAWTDLEAEARRTFTSHVAARRVVDVIGPAGETLAAVGTGHLRTVGSGGAVQARVRDSRPLIELRVPFTVSRQAVDDVARGAKDPDWQPVKDAAKRIAFAEDGVAFDGMAFDGFPDGFADGGIGGGIGGGIAGIGNALSNPAIVLPEAPAAYPNAVAQAMTQLRLAGVGGPYALLLSAEAYTLVAETTDHGYPVREHIKRVLGKEGHIIWAPALSGALLLSTRGGDFELYLGQDLSIGYLSHDANSVELYFQESLTFIVQTAEAGVRLS